jgi:MoaA/NifB/PqqE/SkfB family radical SAM enzyme
MSLVNGSWALLRYKLRHLGVGGTFRVAALDFADMLSCQLNKRFPSLAFQPRSIQIECTTRCNLKCTMCEISYWSEKGGNLEAAKLERMVRHLPRLRRVDLTGVGEALMNRHFFEGLEFLKSRGIYVTMNDNFTMMTEKNARRIIELGVDQIFLSLDGATKETFESIRIGADFDKVIANTRRLIELKRELGTKRPEVKINTVVATSNYHEMPGVVEIAHDLGVGMVSYVNVIVFEETNELDTSSVQRRLDATIERTLARAKELGILVKIELFDKLPVGRCDFPWTRNFVTYDGFVHPCCYTTQTGDRTAQNRRSFGSLVERPFQEMWTDESYSTFRRKMGQGILPKQCGRCPKYHGRPDPDDR